jgi:hypothetical protein
MIVNYKRNMGILVMREGASASSLVFSIPSGKFAPFLYERNYG